MVFIDGRIARIVSDIGKLIYTRKHALREIEIRYGEIDKNCHPYSYTDGWQAYAYGTPWSSSSSGTYALFRLKAAIPDEFAGEKVVLSLHTGRNGWNALNPQMLLYIDGKEAQGLDTNHTEVLLESNATRGKTFDILIYAFGGLTGNHQINPEFDQEIKLFAELRTIEPAIEDFYYNLMVPQLILSQLPEGQSGRIRLENILNDTINRLDLRIVYSKEFYASVEEADNYLREQLYSKSPDTDAVMSFVGHTHIDIAWLWRYCHTRDKAVRSFSTVLKLMEQYPEYVFMSSQPQLYEYIKADHPQVYERIKERVREGRWEAEGGMWVEADTNVPSGESLVRQFLYGKRFFKSEFGVDNKVLWLPDVFGYNGNLPQIMKKSGIEFFMTSKLVCNEINKFPYHTFSWKGIDGSEVLAHLVVYGLNCYNGLVDGRDIIHGWNEYAQKDINDDILMPFGYGDGGGGPTKEMLEAVRRYHKGLPGAPKAKMTHVRDYFEMLKTKVGKSKRLPKWVGELYFEYHRGTYTSMAKNKKYNRKAEFLYTSAEWISAFNKLISGTAYPSEALNEGWKNILLNQFHDVLPGSSIKEVYEDTDKIYSDVFKAGNRLLEDGLKRITASINTQTEMLVVFNTLSWERQALVEFEYPSATGSIYLENAAGDRFECQKTEAGASSYTAFVKGVLPKGYTSFKIVEVQTGDEAEAENPKASQDTHDNLVITQCRLENAFFKIELDAKGLFTSILDKRANREVLKQGEKGNALQAFEDKPRVEDNWNLDIFYSEKMWAIDAVENIEVIEQGPVRGILRITRKFLNSIIVQDIMIYKDIPRIDFRASVDWEEKDIVVKAAFPVDINSERATYEIQYGHIERDTHWNTSWDIAKFEVCAHKWADLSEDGYGVSLLNDCKYGYDIKEGRMRLTLLRCGTIPNPEADKEMHAFTYSLYPHLGRWQEGKTLQEAYDLNCPLAGRTTGKHEGSLPQSLSMIRADRDNVIIEAVKKAEDSEAIIIRVYEAYNRRAQVHINLFKNIESVVECDLMEADGESVPCQNGAFGFTIKPLEIKTFKLKLG